MKYWKSFISDSEMSVDRWKKQSYNELNRPKTSIYYKEEKIAISGQTENLRVWSSILRGGTNYIKLILYVVRN